MCNNTKQKITAALRQMMAKRPFDKITVTNLMDATNMQRQSFYYHFQDTRDVLMWICREELFSPLAESRLDFLDWMILGLHLVDNDRSFFRRAVDVVPKDFIREFSEQAVYPRVSVLLYSKIPQQKLDDNQRFVVEILSNAIIDYFIRFANSHTPLDTMETRKKVQYLIGELKGGCGHRMIG